MKAPKTTKEMYLDCEQRTSNAWARLMALHEAWNAAKGDHAARTAINNLIKNADERYDTSYAIQTEMRNMWIEEVHSL